MSLIFNDFPWHDAILENITINRSAPGEKDTIELLISWPDSKGSSLIEFCDCYAVTAYMNFGIVACESILTAECVHESEELDFIRAKWLKTGIDLQNLKHFKITTNSTGSTIHILALNFNVKKFDS